MKLESPSGTVFRFHPGLHRFAIFLAIAISSGSLPEHSSPAKMRAFGPRLADSFGSVIQDSADGWRHQFEHTHRMLLKVLDSDHPFSIAVFRVDPTQMAAKPSLARSQP